MNQSQHPDSNRDLLITNRATNIVVVRIRSEPGQLGGICLVSFGPRDESGLDSQTCSQSPIRLLRLANS
jgi:hypothetical protein